MGNASNSSANHATLHRTHLQIKDVLARYFPTVFGPKKFIPVKVGIREDMLKEIRMLGLDISRVEVNRFLRVHCTKTPYLKAVIKGDSRYDLDGNAVVAITERERKHAKALLDKAYKALAAKNAAIEAGKKTAEVTASAE